MMEPNPLKTLILRPGEDIEVRGYYHESMKLLEYAEQRIISTVEDTKAATNDLSIISKLKKAMETKKREYLDPLRAQAEAIRETYSTLMDPILRADKITRSKMLDFDAEQGRIRAEQEAINREKQELAVREAALNDKEVAPVELVEVQPEVSSTTRTEMGMAGQTDHWKYEVVDFALLDDAYKMADNAQLTAIARRHHDQRQIPGVRFYNEPYIAVRAK